MEVTVVHDVNINEEEGEEILEHEEEEWTEHTSLVFLQTVAWILAGIIFGVALEKSRVFEPETIRGQMVMRRWVMIKMFLGALSAGQLCLAIMSILPLTKLHFKTAAQNFADSIADKGFLTSALGPVVLGAGMTLSGACPGMVLVQVGSWTKNAIYTFIGVLLGALVYGLIEPFTHKYTVPKKPLIYPTVYQRFGIQFYILALPCALMIFAAVILMEIFIPWAQDLDATRRNPAGANFIQAISWPPSLAGVMIGLMQILIILSVGDTLGGSSGYVTIMSQWVVTHRLQQMFPYLAKARQGVHNWWQVTFVGSAVLGALFASLSSDTFATTKGATWGAALGGGFLMVMGSRFAAGCTSGHGLSGVGLLTWLSFLAVPGMFGGGILTAFIMKFTGNLCQWDYDSFHVPGNNTAIC